MEEKKKAQVSIEILVILGLLVVGAIVFSAYYISNLQHKVGTSAATQGTYADISENIKTEDPQQLAENCGNGYCNASAGETCSTCPQDCGTCPPTPQGLMNLELSLNPEEITPQGAIGHNLFGINAELTGYTEYEDIYIKNIQILNEQGTPVDYCYYDSVKIEVTGYNPNLKMTKINDNYELLLDKFSCKDYERGHTIIVNVGILNSTDYDISSTINKDIGNLTAKLELNPIGDSQTDNPFGVNINVENYNSGSTLIIKSITLKKIDASGYCYYEKTPGNWTNITENPIQVTIPMTRVDNDYNLSLKNKFKCDTRGKYLLSVIVHDNDESDSKYDWLAEIPKNITTVDCNALPGAGTLSDPYQISSAPQLDCVRYFLSSHFKLSADIDLDPTKLKYNTWYDNTKGWLPIGTRSAPFTGSFDGNNHKIKNMYISRDNDVNDIYGGLFLYANNATFKDVNLTDINVSAGVAGGLVWELENSTISNSHITGTLIGANGSGGLVGNLYDSNVTNSSFTGTVIGTASFTGGLIGDIGYINNYSYISNSHFSGDYSSVASYSGGLIGESGGAIIDSCYTTGTVQGKAGCTGGLTGNGGSITYCHSNAEVIGTSSTGGLVGCNGSIKKSYATGKVTGTLYPGQDHTYSIGGLVGATPQLIENSYSTGDIVINNNANDVGGLVGLSGCSITNSYSTGHISISGTGTKIGGLIGNRLFGTITSSYWDINTSGYSTSAGGMGKTTAQMKQQATFVDWNFTDIWAIIENTSYPQLIIPAVKVDSGEIDETPPEKEEKIDVQLDVTIKSPVK